MARFNDVRACGYNSAGSERIWMKFGELRVYCLELDDFTDFRSAKFHEICTQDVFPRPHASF